MSYATQQDMIDRFGEGELLALADRDGDGTIDAAMVERALADAAGLIDSYIGARYALPLVAVPSQLTSAACDVARWRLYTDAPHERVESAYKAAVAWLKDIQAGRADLDADGIEPAADSAGAPVHQAAPRVFCAQTLKDY
ncbi:DUF1320 domain-containing protein [Marivibrio halodurans]|uniref:DUF1320 domain-containing protein n=1 Tax=Marivibrio halodurans TaxID=2039722 RepID=A0A8J7RZS3_9PROT|nr:DUF1320 domain-containing protein [Marivibrio halodurans]MBP5857290.1 DUF1320 domain-containing protein [Marivibrio halodurans]